MESVYDSVSQAFDRAISVETTELTVRAESLFLFPSRSPAVSEMVAVRTTFYLPKVVRGY